MEEKKQKHRDKSRYDCMRDRVIEITKVWNEKTEINENWSTEKMI